MPYFSSFFGDIQISIPDSEFDISTNSERKWNIYTSKSKFVCWQSESTQILKFKDVAIVLWLVKLRLCIFFTHPVLWKELKFEIWCVQSLKCNMACHAWSLGAMVWSPDCKCSGVTYYFQFYQVSQKKYTKLINRNSKFDRVTQNN